MHAPNFDAAHAAGAFPDPETEAAYERELSRRRMRALALIGLCTAGWLCALGLVLMLLSWAP